jgi:hypothetical protein
MCVEPNELVAATQHREIVEQEADFDAAIGGGKNPRFEQMPAGIVLPDEILNVERADRGVRQREPRGQGKPIAIEQPMGRLARGEASLDGITGFP